MRGCVGVVEVASQGAPVKLAGTTMSAPVPLYTTGNIAQALGVKQPRVTEWVTRGRGPAPDFTTSNGVLLWRSLDDWLIWNALR